MILELLQNEYENIFPDAPLYQELEWQLSEKRYQEILEKAILERKFIYKNMKSGNGSFTIEYLDDAKGFEKSK